MADLVVVVAAAVLLLWPAILNGYPIVFSDTGGFLEQALMPDMGWDKPWVYGPFLTPLHLGISLWPAAFAQALLLSAALWLTQAVLSPPRRYAHLALCLILALGTSAPWFASLMMPDFLAPITVLGLFILAKAPASGHFGHTTLAGVALVTTIAIAAHLAHLILAAACIATLGLLDQRSLRRTPVPLVAALAFLLVSNGIGFDRLAISPYGADFALARLVADGPARTTIDNACPTAGWRLCAWKDRLPTDSDDFLWSPHGPVWADGFGPTRLAPEAAVIVRATILSEPGPVLVAGLTNAARQLALVSIGDTLIPDHLTLAFTPRLQAYFPATESQRYEASRQAAGTLSVLAAPFRPIHITLLVAGGFGTLAVAALAWRRHRPLAILALLVLAALAANAVSTGALSGPHDRYQARIAWLIVLVPTLAVLSLSKRHKAASIDQEPKRCSLAHPRPLPATDGNSAG